MRVHRPDYFLGLDLGQASDFTALAVLERSEKIVEIEYPDKPARKELAWHFGCRGLKRWPLGTSYTTIVAEMEKLTSNPPLAKAKLVVDGTGVGRPVVDMFRKARLPVDIVPVMITAGSKETHQDGYFHVAKTILISTLQVLLQQRRLQFARSLPETATLVQELQSYRVKVTPAANEVFNAREGAHDDLLLALALACWHGERSPKQGPFRFQILGTANFPIIRH
jgi:hypothetical protein